MAVRKITAKITDVVQYKTGKLFSEQIFVQFADGRKLRNEPFDSPIMNTENLSKWRQIIVTAVQGKLCPDKAPRCERFDEYKKALEGLSVCIAFDGEVVVGIGTEANRMFFPDAYELFDFVGDSATVDTDSVKP